MGIPIRYNIRNLRRRKLRTLLTTFGIALVIAAAVIMLAYSRGLLLSLRNNGDIENAMILSRRATTRDFSSFKQQGFGVLNAVLLDHVDSHITEEADVIELLAPYISHSFEIRLGAGGNEDVPIDDAYVPRRGLVEGVDPERAGLMHDAFEIVEGRMLDIMDENAAIVGSTTYGRLGLAPEDVAIGKILHFEGRDWEIVGRFSAEGSSADGEIWVPIEELQAVMNRYDFGYAIARAKDEAGMREIVDLVNRSDQMELRAVAEVEYYRGFAETFHTFALIGGVMALIITLGGVMVGMNTMYTAVSGRIREVGLLQIQGFSKQAILRSFLVESLLIALLGGVIGCALGSLINGVPMSVTMGVFLFRVDGLVLGLGLLLAVGIGLVGAYFPARRALKLRMVDAMRYT